MLLPGLLLRALIPLGFMPTFGPGFSVGLMLCEGYAPVPSMAVDMSMDMPMDMPMSVPAQHHAAGQAASGTLSTHTHQDRSHCPYGASPALAALTACIALPALIRASPPALLAALQVAYFEIAPRAQSPRGPPLQV